MNLINFETLETFREILDPDELKDFFLRAKQELDRSLHQLEENFAAQEWSELAASAHRLKGSLGSVGCDALFSRLDKLEDQLRTEPISKPELMQIQELVEIAQKTSALLGQFSV